MPTVAKQPKTAKVKLKYTCGWCGFVFEQKIGTGAGEGKHSRVSSQIICLNCKNGLKTFEGK